MRLTRPADCRHSYFITRNIILRSTWYYSQVHMVLFDRYYSATIIKMSGVKSDEAAVWLSAVTAAVNFVFTFVGLYLVERIGRRPLTIASLLGEIIGGFIRGAGGGGISAPSALIFIFSYIRKILGLYPWGKNFEKVPMKNIYEKNLKYK